MIELRHLRYFVAVAEERNITRAAEKLGVQQPPLTQQIRALETQLGVLLLRRLARGVEPTEAGRVLLEQAKLILSQVEHAFEMTRSTARGEQGRLIVGISSSAAFSPLIPAQLRLFRQHAPLVSISLEEGGADALVEALRLERIDVVFTRSAVLDTTGLIVQTLMEERMVAAVPREHALGQDDTETCLPLAALADEPFILYRHAGSPGLYDRIIVACQEAGFKPKIMQEALRLSSTLNFVSAGLGVTIVPESLVRLREEGVVYRRLCDTPPLKAPLYLVSRKNRSGAVIRFYALAKDMKAGPGGPVSVEVTPSIAQSAI